MSTTVSEAFTAFNKNLVNIDSDRTKVARASRDWLIAQLISLPSKVTDFPRLYDGMHIKYGSFARNTKIRELDDIDLMLTFTAEGTTYSTINTFEKYVLRPPAEAEKLVKLCNEDGTLNSIKLVNKIVSSLNQIDQYKSSEKHRRQEAATLNLSSYEWSFDIVPAFYAADGFYQIPDGSGNWKASDPRVDHERVREVNDKHNGLILQIIRTLKFWNRRAMMTTIPSYLFENMILNYFDSCVSISAFIDFNMRDFWSDLITRIHYPVNDPKGMQGDLNTLSRDERISIETKTRETLTKALEAIRLETEMKDQQAAIKKWAEIFGPQFT